MLEPTTAIRVQTVLTSVVRITIDRCLVRCSRRTQIATATTCIRRCRHIRTRRRRDSVRIITPTGKRDEHTKNTVHGGETSVTIISRIRCIACIRCCVTATTAGTLTVISLEITTSI